jgi:hypothetical protein
MTDLSQAIADATAKLIASGKVEAMVEKNLEKLVADIAQEQLRSYSDFGKKIAAAFAESIDFEISRLNLPSYNAVIVDILKRKFDAIIDQRARDDMSALVDELLKEPPAEIKLSELVEQYKIHVRGHSNEKVGNEVSVVVSRRRERSKYTWDKNSEWIDVGLSEKAGLGEDDLYRCDFRLHVSPKDLGVKGDKSLRVSTIWLGATEVSSVRNLFLGDVYGFQRFLFQLWAAKTPIVLDEDAVDLEIPRDPDSDDCNCDD